MLHFFIAQCNLGSGKVLLVQTYVLLITTHAFGGTCQSGQKGNLEGNMTGANTANETLL